jgi:beta-catenin-like protein 1
MHVFELQESKDKKKKESSLSYQDEEHVLSILVALLTNLASDSIPRIRLLKKFVEDDYSKTARLVSIRTSLLNRVKKREGELERERLMLQREGLELDEVDEYLRRLDAGLYSLQLADYILAWVCMEDDGVSKAIITLSVHDLT